MASLFGHAAAAAAIGQSAPPERRRDWRFWYLAVLCACLPDADVAGFKFGVKYGDLWGHRGLTHSLLFAAVVGTAAAWRFRPDWRKEGWKLALLFFVVTASHGLLDMLTNGGLGVAILSPFDPTRYFFPWTPIQVSPIGAAKFFTERGMAVIASELRWVFVPSLVVGLVLRGLSRLNTPPPAI